LEEFVADDVGGGEGAGEESGGLEVWSVDGLVVVASGKVGEQSDELVEVRGARREEIVGAFDAAEGSTWDGRGRRG